MFKSWFGTQKEKTNPKIVDNVDKINTAIASLRDTISILDKKIKYLEKQIDIDFRNAKECIKNNDKVKATIHLKKKKLKMNNLDKLEAQKHNLDIQLVNLDSMSINSEIIKATKTTNSVMKDFHKANDVDNIDNLADDIQENLDKYNELSDALCVPLIQTDDDELESELDELMQDKLDEELITIPEFPTAPDTKLPTIDSSVNASASATHKKKALTEEEEFEQLRTEFSM